MKKSSGEGFTLIGFLTATAVIGFLAALVLPIMGEIRAKETIEEAWASRIENHKKVRDDIESSYESASDADKGLLFSVTESYRDVYETVKKAEDSALYSVGLRSITWKCTKLCSSEQLSDGFDSVRGIAVGVILGKWSGQKLNERMDVLNEFFPTKDAGEEDPKP